MDKRTHDCFLSLTAFSAVTQCTHWVVSYMASQLQDKLKVKKPRARWSHDEEVSDSTERVKEENGPTPNCLF